MDKYQKVKVLGKGSFGSAILIKRKADGLLFVVKEVAMTKMSKKERDEARHECTVLQQLQHPNIVRYVEQFENRNNLYIVMEYCDGGDLAEKVKQSRGPMKEPSMLYYFSQICLAMEYLHSRHILHRDIKTMNVFLMKNGAVKLGDFGISTVLRTTMGMANTVCGTPYYFSPELCRNRPYNNKSDIWALGVLLYECATGGRHPFDGTSMNQLMQRIVQGQYAPLSSQYSSDFRKMVDWCLQKDPAKRPSIKQTLGLPLMRRSLEQLEENLMLATQCRVRLMDIIDFEPSTDQDQQRKSNSPQQSPRAAAAAAAKDGVSPGQAAALALAHRHPSPTTPSQAPLPSPGRTGAPAAVGPKPTGAGQRDPLASPRQGNDAQRFYSPYQKRPVAHPLVPLGGGGARPAPADTPARVAPPPLALRPAEEPRHAPSPRSNVNLGGGGGGGGGGAVGADRRSLAGGASPTTAAANGPSPDAGDQFRADMRRVDAIIARYGRNTDEKAKETIHAYMRRKQEAYLKRQKEELETRERRNELRKDELRRVLENQRAAVSPVHNNDRRSSPQLQYPAQPAGAADAYSPRRGSPQTRAAADDVQPPPTRSPVSSPSQNRDGASPRTPSSAAPAVFGRDPRRGGGGGAGGEAVSRPTTPQRLRSPSQPRSAAAYAGPRAQTPPRRVVYAANSPQQALSPSHQRHEAPESHRIAAPDPLPSPSSRPGAPRGAVVDIDWRSLADPKQDAAAAARGRRAPLSAGLGGGVGGQRMTLQQQQQQPPQRRHTEDESQQAARDRRDQRVPDDAACAARRATALSPIGGDVHDHRSPRAAGHGGVTAPELATAGAAGDPRLQRPSRAPQRYLKPLGGRGDDGTSPVASPTSGQSPRRSAAAAEHGGGGGGGSPAVSPHARSPQSVSAGHAGPASPGVVDLVDLPRGAVASPVSPAGHAGPVEEALRILRRRKMQAALADGADLPALNMASPELDHGARRNQHRNHSEEAVLYGGMVREQASRDDERFLAKAQARRPQHTEETAVPNTLEALRSLRAQQDRALEAEGGVREEATPGGQLALLKQRHGMQQQQQQQQPRPRHGSASSFASVPLTPPPAASAAEARASPRSEVLYSRDTKDHKGRDGAAGARRSAPHVTALSLGGVDGRAAAPPAAVSAPSSPKSFAKGAKPGAGSGDSGGSGSSGQSSMEGYTEMLQHLKDLLQRRRVSRAGGVSSPATPTAAASAAPPVLQRPSGPATSSPTSQQRRVMPPPLNSAPFGGADAGGGAAAAALRSPPHLNATKPLHSHPVSLPALDIRNAAGAAEEEEDDDDDFEDAVPLSPVRCAELNDSYVRQRQQQQPTGSRQAGENVYTNDVDLTSAAMEEELEGEEGYTGYYKLPSPHELMKGVKS